MKTTSKIAIACRLGLVGFDDLGDCLGPSGALDPGGRRRCSHRGLSGSWRGTEREPWSVDEPAGRGWTRHTNGPAQALLAAIQRPNAGKPWSHPAAECRATRRNPETQRDRAPVAASGPTWGEPERMQRPEHWP